MLIVCWSAYVWYERFRRRDGVDADAHLRHNSTVSHSSPCAIAGVFYACAMGHHEIGRVAIIAFLAISTVLLFVSLDSVP